MPGRRPGPAAPARGPDAHAKPRQHRGSSSSSAAPAAAAGDRVPQRRGSVRGAEVAPLAAVPLSAAPAAAAAGPDEAGSACSEGDRRREPGGFQLLPGAPVLSPLSPKHLLHSGDPCIRVSVTPGRPSPPSPVRQGPASPVAAAAAAPDPSAAPGQVQCPLCSLWFPESAAAAHCSDCCGSPQVGAAQSGAAAAAGGADDGVARQLQLAGASDSLLPTCDLCGETLQLVAGRIAQDAAYYMNDCPHVFSRRCLRRHIHEALQREGATRQHIVCPARDCQHPVASCDLLNFLSREEHERLLSAEMSQFIAADASRAYVQCPSCHTVIERDTEGGAQGGCSASSGANCEIAGVKVSKEQYEHHLLWRFRCRGCGTEFCGKCGAAPYHQGLLCEQLGSSQPCCRWCTERPLFGKRICGRTECEQRNQEACTRTLACGHACPGVRGEESCPPCMVPDCAANETGRSNTDWCSICFCEDLRAAPIVLLDCGHAFHHHCLRKRLLKKWPGPRITFGFLNCPECNQEIAHPAFSSMLGELRKYRQDVRSRALQRLKHEKLDRDAAVSDPSGEYHGNPEAYAEAILSYYQCYVCERPYFGGLRRCEYAQDEQQEHFNPSELVCATCVPFRDFKSCRLHGTEFIEYKCKFCCSIAQWFCWGTTHFCVQCHRMQERGEFVTKKRPSELPQCGGKDKCPLRIDHPENGSGEFALGCALCRFLSETSF
eukprot:TRINITY_DN32029_c0_g2_i2.p1 TRINITY_DN32029_c0_g2~~TRINITY_DN32029_c0_g2_i2.p1  ORF type:complete len:716 (+),score=152.51 TRINITY_DN32029_c0_g2_i2:101-2248(+)